MMLKKKRSQKNLPILVFYGCDFVAKSVSASPLEARDATINSN